MSDSLAASSFAEAAEEALRVEQPNTQIRSDGADDYMNGVVENDGWLTAPKHQNAEAHGSDHFTVATL